MADIYTIGCSNISIDDFLGLLIDKKITAIADVRSTPYSNYTPQFNAEALAKSLTDNGISYLSFAKEFGARRENNDDFTNGKVDYEKVINSDIFNVGISRLLTGIKKGYRIALMCTEKDPIECHRFSMVSRGISIKTALDIKHIYLDGRIETNQVLEKRLLNKCSLQPDLFIDNVLAEAYRLVNTEIGYTFESEDVYG